MHLQSSHPSLTTRINKISSSLNILNPNMQTFNSRDQQLSALHSHRKYKLIHSQIDKIDKMSLGGTMKQRLGKDWFNASKKGEHQHFTEYQDRQQNEQHLSHLNLNHSLHSRKNYHIKKDALINLQKNTSLRVQLIEFNIPSSINLRQKPITVICFYIHIFQTNTHFRSEFTYQTIDPDFRLIFDDVEDIFQYVAGIQGSGKQGQASKHVKFCLAELQLEIRVEFNKGPQLKAKSLKLYMLPFAVVEIVGHHQDGQKSMQQVQLKIYRQELQKDLQIQTNLVNALREESEQLKLKLQSKQREMETLRKDNKILEQTCQKIKKINETNKEYFFEFIPDARAKNMSNFSLKNNLLTKHKNDIKWNQLSSEAPLPHSRRHYFTIQPKTDTPDYMLGIVTLKGKDTCNAFLGLQVICLYISKRNVFVYERGRHYKISRKVKKGEVVAVVVDRERGVVEWIKMIIKNKDSEQMDMTLEERTKAISDLEQHNKSQHKLCRQQLKENQSQEKLGRPSQIQNQSQEKLGRSSQMISSPANTLNSRILPKPVQQQIQFIHSTKIPQQMLSHQLYAYLQVYNINEPLRINEKI